MDVLSFRRAGGRENGIGFGVPARGNGGARGGRRGMRGRCGCPGWDKVFGWSNSDTGWTCFLACCVCLLCFFLDVYKNSCKLLGKTIVYYGIRVY